MASEYPRVGPILCLCQEDNHRKLIPPYAAAFRQLGVPFLTVDWCPRLDVSIHQLLSHCDEEPAWIFHFESDLPLLPKGLERCGIPTVCFQVDTFTYPLRRIRWSSLFDYVAVFHPGYDELYRRSGHNGAFLHPHAVRRDFFDLPEVSRDWDVGWVGQTAGKIYGRRAKWIPKLAATFRMNDWNSRLSLAEVAEIYRRSRVVVNFGRDDYPEDANMRVFEALASGALLVTSLPSELTALGFSEGVHFAGYRTESEIIPIVRKFLDDEPSRMRIAAAARKKVLCEHSYEVRAAQLLACLREKNNEQLAPARTWNSSAVRLAYLDFFAAHGLMKLATSEFSHLLASDVLTAVNGASVLTRAWLHHSLSAWNQTRVRRFIRRRAARGGFV